VQARWWSVWRLWELCLFRKFWFISINLVCNNELFGLLHLFRFVIEILWFKWFDLYKRNLSPLRYRGPVVCENLRQRGRESPLN
jgi:hypothetical protein